MIRPLGIALCALLLAGCPGASPGCSDSGVDGGCGMMNHPAPNPLTPHTWEVFIDDFQAEVDITNISYSDGYCTMAGGAVNSTFTLSPQWVGASVGTIDWNPGRTVSVSFGFTIDSDGTSGAQSGQSSPGAPLSCSPSAAHFTGKTYRLLGDLPSLTGPAIMTSSMPENDYTTGNIGCPPLGNTCHVEYYFDNAPGVAQTTLDLPTLLSTGRVVVPISGSEHNLAGFGETRSGDYTWSGSVTLRAVMTSL
jgi:hypothetical protein